MRVLFLTCPSKTHLYAMAPLAWALQTAGHHVRVAGQLDPVGLTADDIAGTGLTAVSIGEELDVGAMVADAVAESTQPVAVDSPFEQRRKSVQSEYTDADVYTELELLARYHFLSFSPDSLIEDAVRYARGWKPDLVIWDGMTMAFVGPLVARACGAAHARFVFGTDALVQLRTAAREQGLGDPIRDCLQPILERYGLDYDEEMVLGQWSISDMPSWTWQPPGIDYLRMRPVPYNGPAMLPAWLLEEPERPRVCITLGLSYRELNAGPSAGNLLQAVADLDVEVVVTLSQEQLAALPSLPDNVRAIDFVPMTALLPTCSAIVHHGGHGTFISALEHGVPQLLVPGKVGKDKWWGPLAVANGLEEQGAGVYVSDPGRLTPEVLRESLLRVLKDPEFGENAARLRAEAAAIPTPNDIVVAIEKLTVEHRGRR
ncbi:nucleotide disphospho-sugar-binding domain-containing protein [Amycolatopsis sp.]|jgi:glycosyltransferase (activator-dependent family)|uniref:nucleotide disphospho-sugar-binding domain-containing protein n=1 Tax=Amycolatopsis sp. TaxID=37632 RepID=UPI002E0479E2|nr:nucleotide disphospho-sugar-binding domain-containing protein [Amycolatopsis sp.]